MDVDVVVGDDIRVAVGVVVGIDLGVNGGFCAEGVAGFGVDGDVGVGLGVADVAVDDDVETPPLALPDDSDRACGWIGG